MPAHADTNIYENQPTDLSFEVSHHAIGGPVLADDFMPAMQGAVTKVEWWGSSSTGNQWELAFHTNDAALGQPNVDSALQGAFVKYLVTSSGVADVPGEPNIWHYSANIAGPTLLAGTEYWFTAANAADGWTWAEALNGPTVGSEMFNAHSSTGSAPCGDGGPHCGAWTDVHTDFAFRVTSVPEPSTYALMGLPLLLIGVYRRRGGAVSRTSVAS